VWITWGRGNTFASASHWGSGASTCCNGEQHHCNWQSQQKAPGQEENKRHQEEFVHSPNVHGVDASADRGLVPFGRDYHRRSSEEHEPSLKAIRECLLRHAAKANPMHFAYN